MTIQIIISDTTIHQDDESRYSVNDLHKASGNERRHEPNLWLNLQQTKELIEEIINTGNPVFTPAITRRGCRGGTYVCKELVYAYAMWVSAKFHLAVIRAYDALITAPAPKTTVDERTPLRDAVNLLVSKRALPYDQAYSMIHQRFAVQSIEDLEPETLPAAIEYIHRLAIEGELLERQSPAPAMPIFPVNADFDLLTSFRRGMPVSAEIVPEGKMLMYPSDAVEMLRRTGMVIIHHKELSNYPAAQLAALCNAASKEESRWAKVAF
ncbi:KilA-N domain-containing protein [Lelliottia wanjuensis]|uniref:KilA-N domain-containing protein n=1 Tax=Lelliottia wanjuensis TaxID=3050585 RepID=UPI00254EBDAB|nr:KilA-N domain-containing protein [Lelliottia sp. V104_15]MDK9607112.1 KilA-N domain-containing protein [Lelliottia sp. V104_15]